MPRKPITLDDPADWRHKLREAVVCGLETCHAGCGDKARRIKLHGRWTGAFCDECWRELMWGVIPPLTRRRRR